MSLSRLWLGKLSAASLVALLAPGAILGALALLLLTGGVGGLASLGQAFDGPAIPAAGLVAAVGPVSRGGSVRAGHAPAGPVSARAGSPSRAIARASAGSVRDARPTAGRGAPGRRALSRPGGLTSVRPVLASRPAAAAAVPRTPARRRSVVAGVVNVASAVSRRLPGTAGSVVTQTLQSAGSTADRVVPPVPASSRTAVHGSSLSGAGLP